MEVWLFPKSEEGVECRTQQERLTRPPFSGTDGGEREYVGVCIEDQRSCESYSFHGLSGPLAPRTGMGTRERKYDVSLHYMEGVWLGGRSVARAEKV